MSDMLQDASDWLADQLATYAAQQVTYTRGARSITLAATLGESKLRTTDRGGNVKVERTDRDFIITAADLDFGAGPCDPEAGDTITLTQAGKTKRYEVLPYGKDEPVFRPEPGGAGIRIHAKYRGTL